MTKNKERTVAYPHRIMKLTSIYLLKKQPSDGCFIGSKVVNGLTMTVKSKADITVQYGRVFDYALSRIQTQGLNNITIKFDTKEILDEMGLKNRTENRTKIIDSLKSLVDVTITLDDDYSFKLIDSVVSSDGTNIVEVMLDQSFVTTLNDPDVAIRYINIYRTMLAKSKYSIELAKYLQMYGQGVTKGIGVPLPKKEVPHIEVCDFLSLDSTTPSATQQLRKAFNELEKLGYPKYKYKSTIDTWKVHK